MLVKISVTATRTFNKKLETMPCCQFVILAYILSLLYSSISVLNNGCWWQCSTTCGPGVRQRYVSCRYDEGGEADAGACGHAQQPASTERCHDRHCARWRTGVWTPVRLTSPIVISLILLVQITPLEFGTFFAVCSLLISTCHAYCREHITKVSQSAPTSKAGTVCLYNMYVCLYLFVRLC